MAEEEKKDNKMVICTLEGKIIMPYGRSLRKGKSGRTYDFRRGQETEVLESDLKGLQDPKSPQYEPYLKVVK